MINEANQTSSARNLSFDYHVETMSPPHSEGKTIVQYSTEKRKRVVLVSALPKQQRIHREAAWPYEDQEQGNAQVEKRQLI